MAGVKPFGYFKDRLFTHAVDQQVRLAVQKDGPPYLIRPEIIVTGTAHGRLDTAQHHGQSGKGVSDQAGVYETGAVGPGTMDIAGRVRIIMAQLAESGVMGEHGIEGACGNTGEQAGPAQAQDIFRSIPARLRDNTDAIPGILQYASEQRHAEGRVVHIRIT
ncbi:MAG: hypothetical protein BWX80_02602 [Candidatus Hydrogenedentes bacterium ADurb.Bin101]|nr:MAG: hypothetical protein BWX80_02602 [Candidatus Hydrogenedentes bacterium ADurb.Bin101]